MTSPSRPFRPSAFRDDNSSSWLTITCPLCQMPHEWAPGDPLVRPRERCSHMARVVYCQHVCSICLEEWDKHVALKCGHLICEQDFGRLGGTVGEDSLKRLSELIEEKMRRERMAFLPWEAEQRMELRALRGQNVEFVDTFVEHVQEEIEGQESDDEYERQMWERESEWYSIQEEENESDSDSPPWSEADEQHEGATEDPSAAESTDSDMPALLPRDAAGSNDASSSSFDSIPPLLPRDTGGNDSESISEEELSPLEGNDNVEGGSDRDSDSPPPLCPREDSFSNSDDSSRAPMVIRSRVSSSRSPTRTTDRVDDSSDSSLPDLLPRTGRELSDDDEESDEITSPTRTIARSRRAERTPTNPRVAVSSATTRASRGPHPTHGSDNGPREQRTFEDFAAAARLKGRRLKPSQLKKELRKMGVDTTNIVEKSALIESFASHKARLEMNDLDGYVRSSAGVAQGSPVTATSHLDRPILVTAQVPPANGIWIGSPTTHSGDTLEYFFLLNHEIRAIKMQTDHAYSPLFNMPGSAVLCNKESQVGEIHEFNYFDPSVRVVTLNVSTESMRDIALSGSSTYYMLWAEDSRIAGSTLKLGYRSDRAPTLKTLLTNLPSSTRIYPCSSGYVWVDIRDEPAYSPISGSLAPGLWYVSRWEKKLMLATVELPQFTVVDTRTKGLWILRPNGETRCVLLHIDVRGCNCEHNVELSFNAVQSMVDAGINRDGVFVHYKSEDRWKLGLIIIGQSFIESYCDCARNSIIVSCGQGGVWMWKMVGRQKSYRLSYVDPERTVFQLPRSFEQATELGGFKTE